MNKSDLVETITEELKTLSKKEVDLIIDTIFEQMMHSLKEGDRIEIRGFGSFEIRSRDSREGRNPKTGETVFVRSRKVPFFKAGKELKHRINESIETSASA
ncbi:MAG: integration host factor subunit beta [Deltaproteobacteria bacterium]|nr:integration host factor subunit beta [Deltaproteobacteria bacterium]